MALYVYRSRTNTLYVYKSRRSGLEQHIHGKVGIVMRTVQPSVPGLGHRLFNKAQGRQIAECPVAGPSGDGAYLLVILGYAVVTNE